MGHLQAWSVLLAVVIGNCAFWLFCFNRINATGLDRHVVKSVDKAFILICFLLPLGLAFWEWPHVANWLSSDSSGWLPYGATLFSMYGIGCILFLCMMAPFWIESRWWMIPPVHLVEECSEEYHVHRLIEGGSTGDRLTTFLNKLPGNEITRLQVNQKTVVLPRQLKGFDQLSIGHLSDLHFTGQLRRQHFEYVVERLQSLKPDLIVISGDIIDEDDCLDWIHPVLGDLTAPLGCTYVIGNHERKLSDPSSLHQLMSKSGYFDLGSEDQMIETESGSTLHLIGNERPWFERHTSFHGSIAGPDPSPTIVRIGVSHAPDQLPWARKEKIDLLLAGHTHGGQVRLPIIGPFVAPSWYGSKYASGLFFKAPTLMHVSRGLSGTHPYRWRCTPEVTLLRIRFRQ